MQTATEGADMKWLTNRPAAVEPEDPNPRTFDAMLRAAFDAGAEFALGRTITPSPEAEAARVEGFAKWKRGFLP